MKYEKKVTVGAFLKKGEDFKEHDILEVANEGKPVPGKFGTQNVFLVKLPDGRDGNVAFNQTTINNLIDGYGADSINWIGKKVKVWKILSNVQGKMTNVYYFMHPDTILEESSGSFIIPGITDQKEAGDVDVADIPF